MSVMMDILLTVQMLVMVRMVLIAHMLAHM